MWLRNKYLDEEDLPSLKELISWKKTGKVKSSCNLCVNSVKL
jgi:hypothetical protein